MNLPAVDEIDFLPAGYHARQLRSRARGWRWALAAAFAGLAGLGLAGNHLQRARLATVRDRLAPQAGAVADLDRQSAELRTRIDALDLRADVRARLRLRPATTRLLAAATAALPAHTSLTELRVTEAEAAEAPAPPQPAADAPPPPPARLDLDRLASGGGPETVVTLRGLAPDDAAVSEFLARLGRSGLCQGIRLVFTDHHDHGGHDLRSFSIELRVRVTSSTSQAVPQAVAAGLRGDAS